MLADPDLARNLGKLLQIYRDAPPDRREQALLAAMREIKQASNATLTSTKVAEIFPTSIAHPDLGHTSVRA